jgi:hypothetical protein
MDLVLDDKVIDDFRLIGNVLTHRAKFSLINPVLEKILLSVFVPQDQLR